MKFFSKRRAVIEKEINGAILTVGKVEADGCIITQEGVIVPSDYRQVTHGYVEPGLNHRILYWRGFDVK